MATTVPDPDRPCSHEEFSVSAEVNRIVATDDGPVTAYSVDLTVTCRPCGEKFRWIGCPAGLRPDGPTVSLDETQLRAPIRPSSSDPDFGLGIPGFAVNVVVGGQE